MTPQDLGLPQSMWRPQQWDFVSAIADHPAPHQLLVAPTGFGKSLTYIALQRLTGWRVVVLTATRALQDQLMREFEQAIGLVDVRGQSNYECVAATNPSIGLGLFFRAGRRYTVRDAPCSRGIMCPLKDRGCAYYDRIREAAAAPIFVTNYDFWFRNKGKMGPVDLLVCDEAHQAPGELQDFLSFRLTRDQKRLLKRNAPTGEDAEEWAQWAEWAAGFLKEQGDDSQPKMDLRRDLERMAAVLTQGEWVIEHTEAEVRFDCISAPQFGAKYLWGGADRCLLVSATVNPMTAAALGMNAKEVKVWEAESGFPVERRPVYAIKGAVRLNFRSTEGEKRMWVNLIDRILASRSDRKGIVHTTSFERARYLAEHSRHTKRLLLNTSIGTGSVVQNFRQSASPLVLVSPSVTTGWDFPGSDCEFQIIGKIPFPDLRTKAAKVLNQRNKEWGGYTSAQTVVQSSGRGMRSADDQCETFIVDGNFDWWWGQNRKYLPKWWQDALKWVGLTDLPQPPPKL